MKNSHVLALTLLALVAATPSAFAADAAAGKKLYDERCASCHGALGAGDGPVAQALPPEMKPRNLQNAPMKVATDDAKLKELIEKGGAAMGLNPLMPPQTGLAPADLDNLIAYVHSLKKG